MVYSEAEIVVNIICLSDVTTKVVCLIGLSSISRFYPIAMIHMINLSGKCFCRYHDVGRWTQVYWNF
jgi:hypothetical protein